MYVNVYTHTFVRHSPFLTANVPMPDVAETVRRLGRSVDRRHRIHREQQMQPSIIKKPC